MKVVFYHSPSSREAEIAAAMSAGARAHGDILIPLMQKFLGDVDTTVDAVMVVGVAGRSRLIIDKYRAAGKAIIYIDKAYIRAASRQYYKVAVGGFQPLHILMTQRRNPDRWHKIQSKFRINLCRYAPSGRDVMLLGPSEKYCLFHGIGGATQWSAGIVSAIAKVSKRHVVYRPKASWDGAVPIPGTTFSRPPIELERVIENSWCIVVHGSNASVEAIIHGIPVVTLGPAIARPVSMHSLDRIDCPDFPSDGAREEWLSNICYHQWNLPEMTSGEAWEEVRQQIKRSHAYAGQNIHS